VRQTDARLERFSVCRRMHATMIHNAIDIISMSYTPTILILSNE